MSANEPRESFALAAHATLRLAGEVRLTEEGWKHGDKTFGLQEQVSEPGDQNILYGFRRTAASDEIMEEIQELFAETRFEMRLLEATDTGKKPVKIVVPASESED